MPMSPTMRLPRRRPHNASKVSNSIGANGPARPKDACASRAVETAANVVGQTGDREPRPAVHEVVARALATAPAGPGYACGVVSAEFHWKPLQSGERNPFVSYGATAATPGRTVRCSTMNRPW